MKCESDEILNNEANANKILSEDKLLLNKNDIKNNSKKLNEKQTKKY